MRYGSFRKSTKCFEPPAPTLERSERTDVAVVSVIELDGQRVSVKVADLSERGLGGQSAMPLPIGAQASVTLPRIGPVPAEDRAGAGADPLGARHPLRRPLRPEHSARRAVHRPLRSGGRTGLRIRLG
jgi:hypothetical protein